MRQRGTQIVITAVAFSACVALATGLVFARGGGGHGGGHGGHHGGHHSSHHHSSHHASHHHAGHHNGHHGGYGGYGGYGGWGGGYGGWGGYGGYGGYGYGGGWGDYNADEPISVPIAGLDGVNNATSFNNQAVPNEDSEDQLAQVNPYDDDNNTGEMASNDKDEAGDEDGDDEDNDIDYRGAIQLVLPNKDAHVFLNGKLVLGVGTRRLMLTPEIEDENKPEKFHVLAVWEENGRPKQREADVELTAGGGIALNLTKDKPTESALPTVSPENTPAPAETASTETETKSKESTPAATENATEKLTR